MLWITDLNWTQSGAICMERRAAQSHRSPQQVDWRTVQFHGSLQAPASEDLTNGISKLPIYLFGLVCTKKLRYLDWFV
jgi:hypothetical protein